MVLLDFKNILQLEHYLQLNKPLEEFAAQYGITDIYSDNNIKQLQQTLYLGLDYASGRRLYDATDASGHKWELKSVDITGSKKSFTTCSYLSQAVLARYKECRFAFSVYQHTELQTIYVMESNDLAPYFHRWQNELQRKPYLNNPRIQLSYVQEFGHKVFDMTTQNKSIWKDPVQVLSVNTSAPPNNAWLI